MQQRNPESTSNPGNNNSSSALIVVVQTPEQSDGDLDASCAEMEKLAATLGIRVCRRVVQKRGAPASAGYVGSGKLDEIESLVEQTSVDTILVDDDLRPRQHRVLQRKTGVAVRDRTDVILDIFERRAGTKQAQLEVEIARLRYELPRLRDDDTHEGRRGWRVDDGEMSWEAIGPASLSMASVQSIAQTLVALQSVDSAKVAAADLPVHDIDEVRQLYRTWLEETKMPLGASDSVVERWVRWLDSDANWPSHTALVHGDFHPGHMLFDDVGRLRGVLDWTEIKMWDPAEDLLIFFGCFGDEGLEQMVEHFAACGGTVWPGIEDHVREAWFFTPVKIAAWAIKHDDDTVMEHARGQLRHIAQD